MSGLVKPLGALLAAVALFGVGCSSSAPAAGGVTKVVATDTECKPARTELAAGKQTFEVHNEGRRTTEMYVYGHKDKYIGEVEDIGPGASRPLTVDVKAGEFQLACKPGQTADGIRAAIKVTGKGGTESAGSATADRDVEVVATEYKFIGLENFSAKTGETDLFSVINNGKEQHELEIRGPDGK